MKLSILIATIGRRDLQFRSLVKKLHKQAEDFAGMIEIVAYWNNGELSIGEIRQELLNQSNGEYVCFVDDDDEIPSYYCTDIIHNLGKDYVGFKVSLFNDGILMPPVYHSLRYNQWRTDYDGYYRDITHLNPIKRDIAIQGTFSISGAGEDSSWADSIRGLIKDENYIDKVMYIYKHESQETSFSTVKRLDNKQYKQPKLKYKYFRYIKKG